MQYPKHTPAPSWLPAIPYFFPLLHAIPSPYLLKSYLFLNTQFIDIPLWSFLDSSLLQDEIFAPTHFFSFLRSTSGSKILLHI